LASYVLGFGQELERLGFTTLRLWQDRLELGWEALKDARIAPDAVRGRDVGVFVGVTAEDYAMLARRAGAASLNFEHPHPEIRFEEWKLHSPPSTSTSTPGGTAC
jgi:hypothetical protein